MWLNFEPESLGLVHDLPGAEVRLLDFPIVRVAIGMRFALRVAEVNDCKSRRLDH